LIWKAEKKKHWSFQLASMWEINHLWLLAVRSCGENLILFTCFSNWCTDNSQPYSFRWIFRVCHYDVWR